MTRRLPEPGSPRDVALLKVDEGKYGDAVLWLERALAAARTSDERQPIAAALGEVARSAQAAGELDQAQRALELATRVVSGSIVDSRYMPTAAMPMPAIGHLR